MKILIIGQGGREHALAWKVAQSPLVNEVWVAPGNAGTAQEHKVQNVAIAATAVDDLATFAKNHDITLTIVGPESALAAGIVDVFSAAGLACFGPKKDAARLETSKQFCKDFLQQHDIPTAKYACFSEITPAINYLHQQSLPIVIKADGLAAGKGVIIAESLQEAEQAIHNMLSGNAFGQAGQQIVIEEFLHGYEISYIIMSDGQHILALASSIDHKRRNDCDLGPNTGGMGALSPAPQLNSALEQTILNTIMRPTLAGMASMGTPYVGFLYAGLMINSEGQPKVLEFNCRLGDPETQPILMRLQSDLVELCLCALQGQLNTIQAHWDQRSALSVVMTAGEYPDSVSRGAIIHGLTEASSEEDCKIFHAATKQVSQNIVTDGGRILGVTTLGDTLKTAKSKAYAAVKKISWPHCHYRNDIGQQAIEFMVTNHTIAKS